MAVLSFPMVATVICYFPRLNVYFRHISLKFTHFCQRYLLASVSSLLEFSSVCFVLAVSAFPLLLSAPGFCLYFLSPHPRPTCAPCTRSTTASSHFALSRMVSFVLFFSPSCSESSRPCVPRRHPAVSTSSSRVFPFFLLFLDRCPECHPI